MQKVVRVKRKNFTIVGNEMLRNKKMSYKAKGLMCYLLSHVDNWGISLKKLAFLSFEGIKAIRTGLNELVDEGYVKKCEFRNESGKFDVEYFVSEFPEDLTACHFGTRSNRMPFSDADKGMRSSTIYKNTIKENYTKKSSSVVNVKSKLENYGINEVMIKNVENVIDDDDDLEFFFKMIKRIDDEIEAGKVKRVIPYIIVSLGNFIIEVKSEGYLEAKERGVKERRARERKSVERKAKEREAKECQEFYDSLREADKEILIDEAVTSLGEKFRERYGIFMVAGVFEFSKLPDSGKDFVVRERNKIIIEQMGGCS